jgi:hypothetical protein
MIRENMTSSLSHCTSNKKEALETKNQKSKFAVNISKLTGIVTTLPHKIAQIQKRE